MTSSAVPSMAIVREQTRASATRSALPRYSSTLQCSLANERARTHGAPGPPATATSSSAPSLEA